MTTLRIQDVSKHYGRTRAVDGVSLEVPGGAFLTLLGDSGCGKTTLLRVLAGFAAPDAGRLWRGDEEITHLPPKARRMGFVFQSYALFPTKTVADNIGFALKIAGRPRDETRRRVGELARLMELDALLGRYPHELSGGQQQRVALARALAPRPDVLLLDEPLSALDARIRAKLRGELRGLVDRLGITTVYVTHDQEEALAVSDLIAVMRAGRIVQLGTPSEIYHRPRSRFVATFVGTANLLEGRVATGGIESDGRLWPARLPSEARPGEFATVMLRPEHLSIAGGEDGMPGQVESLTFLGSTMRAGIRLDGGRRLLVDCPSTASADCLRPGERVGVRADAERAVVLIGADAR
ncbi:MAG: ABC transporter ATP-binding protein [Alphaproteobacteria bacterium]|nr:ABC transporter ATP-binding protein [Alphaproteobacteria bacterium]